MKVYHILIVDDSIIAQLALKTQLLNQGCMVDVASDGFAAMQQASSTAYDLILMDIGLGDGVDGFEVTTMIKQKSLLNQQTPVIAVTASNEPDFRHRAMTVGMVGYLNKPLTTEDTIDILCTLSTQMKGIL
ncbi:MAG: response regulator [Legionella sp.]